MHPRVRQPRELASRSLEKVHMTITHNAALRAAGACAAAAGATFIGVHFGHGRGGP